ncbi:unnamed protein product [Cylindrotheca closterium]|uniref:Kinesin motor domain-containing protein n=1 Tax=Cylindrotheca closterium TaxID=2856 RepID=A0AAD2FIJ9_9STRA|nr:unnamed protein product [Cylindrotheca closterium]
MRQPVSIPNAHQGSTLHAGGSHNGSDGNKPKRPSDYSHRSSNVLSPRSVASGQRVIPLGGGGGSNDVHQNKQPSGPRSAHLQPKTEVTAVSQTSGSKGAEENLASGELDKQEQALFEQRLCEDEFGVAVRKINQNGKSNLRYVRCIEVDLMELDDEAPASSNRSVSSISKGSKSFVKGLASLLRSDRSTTRSRSESVDRNELTDFSNLLPGGTMVRCLTWGKKKGVRIPLERFTSVRKGKTTDRTKRNACPSVRILSLITNDPYHRSLDIEAPTRLDRDKFAKAFSKFLNIPLETDENRSTRSDLTPVAKSRDFIAKVEINSNQKNVPVPVVTTTSASPNRLPPSCRINANADKGMGKLPRAGGPMELPSKTSTAKDEQSTPIQLPKANVVSPSNKRKSSASKSLPSARLELPPADDASAVSSITGVGVDQEIIEEMHNALTVLRAELDESRAEAARAVKVAEQAIQSAENNNSKDWHSTVTHKAAEAAALAQKKSAAALARARQAEDKFEIERQNAAKWQKQAQSAEEDAGYWRTRAAAAEVERSSIADSLETDRNNIVALLSSMREKNGSDLEGGKRNRALKAELEILRSSLASRDAEVMALRNCMSEVESTPEAYQVLRRKPRFLNYLESARSHGQGGGTFTARGIVQSQSQVEQLRSKLAMETTVRRKLQHEVLDLRGAVRVYCRPRAITSGISALSTPSREVVVLHRERSEDEMPNSTPLSFEFDGIVTPDMDQQELYSEMEQVCLNVLDGFNSTIMTFGPSRAGKTFTMLGDVGYSIAADSIEPVLSLNNFGVHLRAARQLFSVIEQRSDKYNDTVTFSVLEVHEEKLYDLLVGTDIGESHGTREMPVKNTRRRAGSTCSSSSAMGNSEQLLKLELKTNHDGETCISGLISVQVNSFEDVCRVWKECLSRRVSRLAEQGIRLEGHDHNCHTIGTMRISSTNLSTGSGTLGKVQFVDFAASDIVKESRPVRASNPDMLSSVGPDLRFANKSIATLSDVVHARSQFQRSVPYRNSTITHLLSDSLEADTKVVMIACVSSDVADIQETACTLKFAERMRQVIVGKATTHSLRTNA